MRLSRIPHTLFGLLLLATMTGSSWAQDAAPESDQLPEKAIGTLVYFEGAVEVAHSGTNWAAAKIDQHLRPTQKVRTGANASAEIQWGNGTSTVIGPESKQSIAALFERARKNAPSASDGGVVQKFVDLFAEDQEATSGTGGIRRGQPSVSFAEAARTYENAHYRKAVRKLHLYLEQNPLSPNAKKVRFALGHSYLKLNNPLQAEAEFEAIVQTYPDHPLADRARTILEEL